MVDEGRWERWERVLKDQNADPLEVLTVSTMYQRYFDAVQKEAVRAARASGRSWAEIADAAGIAKQSAWEKWKDVSTQGEDLQRQFDERVARERREAVHAIAEQTARLAKSGELRQQANELRKAVLSLTLSPPKRRRP